MKYGDTNSENNKLENFNLEKSIFLLLVSSFIFLMILSSACALSSTYSKLGNELSSATGLYATSSHCNSADTCTWISGNQVIIGVYSGGFTGGSATWNFNITQPLSQITAAELQLSWPSVYGKGLHSVGTNTTSTIMVGSTIVASPSTSTAISCGTGDRYAYACFNATPTYSIPVSAISSNTNVTISVPANTLWDIGLVKLVITYSPPITCSTNTQCGANDWVAGTNSCSNNDVYQNFKTYTCNNPGTTSSTCSNSTALTFKTDCGDTTYGSWGTNYCNGNIVEKSRDVYNKGCATGACTSSTTTETQTVQTCTNGCTNGTCNGATIVCSTNVDCGIDGTVGMYPYSCVNNDRYAMYRTHTCSNPGTSSSSCSYVDGPKMIQDCGETHTDPWVTTCNVDLFIQRTQITYNQGCVQEGGLAYCEYYEDHNTLPLIYCENGCLNGACNNSACWMDSQCGVSNWVAGTTQCYLNNVYQNYTTIGCKNPGYTNASCSSVTELKLKENCANGCTNGVCSTNATGIKIENGKIKINGVEFLIKGLDYAPWLTGTGPDSTVGQLPFPKNKNDDVTAKVTSNNKVNVTDYSGDGKIQAWEVIRFDVETMKKVGANTIRTYATGSWHDKDLDGVVDVSTNLNLNEIIQGDLNDWVLDELLNWANTNNMKVIIGYWVQEENFKETPLVANWDDLPVAKQAFGRVVNKYKSNPAVLGWGIGNEVNGSFNQGWFSWGVNVNEYLNALFAYTRTLDTAHPIIYAKYIGENTNFDNLTADIMSINAYIHSATDLVNYGEFNIAAPNGKAYMLGEFGHLIEQAEGHWNLSKNYAGGAFLEYNNVWWKGSGHNTFGIVDEFRAKNESRYSVLTNLFGGAPVCSNNAECNDNNSQTNDVCLNPNTTSSTCTYTLVPIVCSSNSQCGANNWLNNNYCSSNNVWDAFRTYTCNNPGTISSSCTSVDINQLRTTCATGQICNNAICATPICSTNLQCNDNNSLTNDVCVNPGTLTSVCQSTPIVIGSKSKAELAIFDSASNSWYVYQNNTGNLKKITLGNSTDILIRGDYDGDKRIDPAVFRPSNVNWYVAKSSNNFVVDSINWGVKTDTPVPADYDGDGKTDRALFRSSNGTWYIAKSGSNFAVDAIKWGVSTDTLVPADYDGDGKVDRALFRSSTATWYIAKSGSNFVVDVFTWGAKTDTPVPADYDGDGKVDIAIYRPSTGAWYIKFSNAEPTDLAAIRKTDSDGYNYYELKYNNAVVKGKPVPADYCNGDNCATPVCYTNLNCGADVVGAKTCSGNNVVQTNTIFTCTNPNTLQSSCNKTQTTPTLQVCTNGCSNGVCLPPKCGFNDGIIVSAEAKAFTAWDISQIQLLVKYKSGTTSKTITLTKNGNNIYSGTGAYAISSSCGGICNWIRGNQVIVGAYNSNPSSWGGKVSWKFDLGTIDITKITQLTVKVLKPNVYGKGLHSPYTTGAGVLTVENLTLANLQTKTVKCGTDWFAHACATTTLSYSKTINSSVCVMP